MGKYLDSCVALIGVLERARIDKSELSAERIDGLMWNCKTIECFADKAQVAGEIDLERNIQLKQQAGKFMDKLQTKRSDLDA